MHRPSSPPLLPSPLPEHTCPSSHAAPPPAAAPAGSVRSPARRRGGLLALASRHCFPPPARAHLPAATVASSARSPARRRGGLLALASRRRANSSCGRRIHRAAAEIGPPPLRSAVLREGRHRGEQRMVRRRTPPKGARDGKRRRGTGANSSGRFCEASSFRI